MQIRKIILAITILVFLLSNTHFLAEAASGLPNSPQFGYGASISLSGQQISRALSVAPELGIDWLRVNFDWARLWPEQGTEPDLSAITGVIDYAQQRQISILLSISNPPTWAMTPSGPDPAPTATISLYFTSKYPETVLAVELFPGANTVAGWGATPDPSAYIELIQSVRNTLLNQKLRTYVIPGITPLSGNATPGDMDDLEFLKKIYEADMPTPIVGIRYRDLQGQPFAEPGQTEPGVLRHYELVRNFMLQNNRRTDLIWITGFSWPSQLASSQEQAAWLYEAYELLKAQLYIGVAFFNYLNPSCAADHSLNSASLILTDGNLHPAASQLRKVTSAASETLITSLAIPQNPKGMIKKHMHKTISKRPSS